MLPDWLKPAIVAAALAGSAVAAGSAQTAQFRAGVQTVALYVTVRDRDGHLVPNLEQRAFEVLDSGRPADITVFSNAPQPLSVAIMLDMSGSMRGAYDSVRKSVLNFVNALRPEDRASIGSFGTEIAVGANLTSDRAELVRVLKEELWPGGGSPGWTAISQAMSSLANEPGRRVVLTLTDGDFPLTKMPGWTSDAASVESQAAQEECAVYAVGFESLKLTKEIVRVAERTGGGHFEVAAGSDLSTTFADVAEELRHQYLIGFSPRINDGKPHEVDVRTVDGRYRVQARKQYIAGSGK